MALIIEEPTVKFDLEQIRRGDLMYAKHYTWNEGIGGFVTAVTEDKLAVQYHPGIGNVTNHFFIPAAEVKNGEWEIRWSEDLSEVKEYVPDDDTSGDDEGNESEPSEPTDPPTDHDPNTP